MEFDAGNRLGRGALEHHQQRAQRVAVGDDDRWLAQVVVTPTCGLAGASPEWTRTSLAACRAVGRVLRHDEDDRTEASDGR